VWKVQPNTFEQLGPAAERKKKKRGKKKADNQFRGVGLGEWDRKPVRPKGNKLRRKREKEIPGAKPRQPQAWWGKRKI